MANLNFKKDLVLGNIGENVIIEFLISNGLTYLESNDDNRYDFIMLKDNVKQPTKLKPMYYVDQLTILVICLLNLNVEVKHLV
jgi:hypothetical protein